MKEVKPTLTILVIEVFDGVSRRRNNLMIRLSDLGRGIREIP